MTVTSSSGRRMGSLLAAHGTTWARATSRRAVCRVVLHVDDRRMLGDLASVRHRNHMAVDARTRPSPQGQLAYRRDRTAILGEFPPRFAWHGGRTCAGVATMAVARERSPKLG